MPIRANAIIPTVFCHYYICEYIHFKRLYKITKNAIHLSMMNSISFVNQQYRWFTASFLYFFLALLLVVANLALISPIAP